MDNSQFPEQFPTPFRPEVTSAEHKNILNINANIETAFSIFDTPEDKPIIAGLLGEIVMSPEAPNESKMEAFGKVVDLIEDPTYVKENGAIARQLIDMVRAQPNKALRIRLASIVSSQLKTKEEIEADLAAVLHDTKGKPMPSGQEILSMGAKNAARVGAFAMLASDQGAPEAYRRYSRYIQKKQGVLALYNQLYRHNADLVVNPDIIREITEEADGVEVPNTEEDNNFFSGLLVKLNPPALPTREKIERWKENAPRLGLPKELPVYLVRKAGEKFISIAFHPDQTMRLAGMVSRMRELESDMSRPGVREERRRIFDEAESLGVELLNSLNPQQRQEFLTENVHVRFATERATGSSPVISEGGKPASEDAQIVEQPETVEATETVENPKAA